MTTIVFPSRYGTQPVGQSQSGWDKTLLMCITALMVIGLIMVYSASISYAERVMGNEIYFAVRHFIYASLGLLAMFIVMRIPVSFWERSGPYLLLLSIVLLIAVLIPGIGTKVNGSARWIKLGVMNLQPAEFVKIFMVIYVSGYLIRKQNKLKNFTQGILMISIVVAVIGMLLLQEPDFGTVVVISITTFAMLFLSGVRFWHFLSILSAGVGGMIALTLMSPYRVQRVTSFLDPWADPFNSGFQLTQALIAFGRGEWFGVGLGASIQKMFYLPAAYTDFILAVLAEELGLFAVLGVMALYAVLVAQSFRIARQAEQRGNAYAARLAQGIGVLFGIQVMINMGVNMGVLPTKGLTLPFISYGGSSLLASFVAVGILLAISRETRTQEWKQRR
ncbi:MAG: putative lipid II flippase FtsW [Gammaproteobacteria bacterium]|nr:MAG: putative lipid II flippase FtsW [Gammaproteobacteria bacterium]